MSSKKPDVLWLYERRLTADLVRRSGLPSNVMTAGKSQVLLGYKFSKIVLHCLVEDYYLHEMLVPLLTWLPEGKIVTGSAVDGTEVVVYELGQTARLTK